MQFNKNEHFLRDVKNASGNNLFLILGMPGSGKTFRIQNFINSLQYNETFSTKKFKIFCPENKHFANEKSFNFFLNRIMKRAHNEKYSILFLNEMEGVFSKRDSNNKSMDEIFKISQMLTFLEDKKMQEFCTIFVTANNANIFDEAFLRAGRFSNIITFNFQNYPTRKDLIKNFHKEYYNEVKKQNGKINNLSENECNIISILSERLNIPSIRILVDCFCSFQSELPQKRNLTKNDVKFDINYNLERDSFDCIKKLNIKQLFNPKSKEKIEKNISGLIECLKNPLSSHYELYSNIKKADENTQKEFCITYLNTEENYYSSFCFDKHNYINHLFNINFLISTVIKAIRESIDEINFTTENKYIFDNFLSRLTTNQNWDMFFSCCVKELIYNLNTNDLFQSDGSLNLEQLEKNTKYITSHFSDFIRNNLIKIILNNETENNEFNELFANNMKEKFEKIFYNFRNNLNPIYDYSFNLIEKSFVRFFYEFIDKFKDEFWAELEKHINMRYNTSEQKLAPFLNSLKEQLRYELELLTLNMKKKSLQIFLYLINSYD